MSSWRSKFTGASSSRNPMALHPGKIILQTNDLKEFVTEISPATQSTMIKDMVEDGFCGCVPLLNVSGDVLAKILEFWRNHAEENRSMVGAAQLKKLDEEFVKVEDDMMIQLANAANYLNCKPLIEVVCQAIADHIKDCSIEEARAFLGIECDFTPEEEQKIREGHAWAFDL